MTGLKGKRVKKLFATSVLVLSFLLAASAQQPGFDLLETESASIDFDSPGLANVPLKGMPIAASTGSADTIIHRMQAVPAAGGAVAVEVYALLLKGVNPVSFLGQPADLYVTINNTEGVLSMSVLPQPDALAKSTGTISVRTDGTLDANITLNADLIFVKAGGRLNSIKDQMGHIGDRVRVTLTSKNSSWSSAAPSGYPSPSALPSGGLYPARWELKASSQSTEAYKIIFLPARDDSSSRNK